MLKNISVFALASARLAHASRRNEVITRNVANADTPGFKAQDVERFDLGRMLARSEHLRDPKATRAGHVAAAAARASPRPEVIAAAADEESPDGNTVSLEQQMVQAAETKGTFDLAATLYRKNLSLLRTALGRAGR